MSKLYFKLLLSLSILAITSACSQDMADQPRTYYNMKMNVKL